MTKIITMSEKDNVATSLAQLKSGEFIEISVGSQVKPITLIDDIQFGYKVAITSIEQGQEVIKYGEVIGIASQTITQGQCVHVHNVESIRGRGDKQ